MDLYQTMLSDAKQTLLSLSGTTDGWKTFSAPEAKDISFWCKEVKASIKRQVKVSKDAPKGYIRKEKKYKMWLCVADIPSPIDSAFRVLTDIPGAATWNKAVGSARVLQQLDASSDITWIASNPKFGGTLSARDFVGLRRIDKHADGSYVISTVGIVHPDIPLVSGNVRGWSGPGGFILRPINAAKCRLTWILNADSRPPGWIPPNIVDRAVVTILIQTVQALRDTSHNKQT